MKIAVFGSGGVGGYLGARLAEAGGDVAFVARGEHLAALRDRGLRLESIVGDALIHPVRASDDPAELGPVDCVLVTVKTWDLPQAAERLGPLLHGDSFVVPLLNGVEAVDVLADVVGRDNVVGGLCGMISFIAGPGHIRHAGADPWVTVGELDRRITDRVRRLEEAFGGCRGVRFAVADDIHVALWDKFLFITATGGVGAVTRVPMGEFRSLAPSREMLDAAMREVLAVARARGVDLTEDAVIGAMALVDGLPPDGTSSLQRDVLDGRRTELEAWNGAVVRLGQEAGVATPVHSFIYSALLPQDLRARGALDDPP